MIGCLKVDEVTNRDPTSKYFTPRKLFASDTLPYYFSGATYIIDRSAIFKVGTKFPVKRAYFSKKFVLTYKI